MRFIQVTHSDSNVQWDQHSDLKDGHEKNAREVDRPIAGLLNDLKARGLLDDTLVWWGGEFGRTPDGPGEERPRPQPRRLHDVAGRRRRQGGLRYGSTDDYGYYAVEDKVHIHDLHATILHLLGPRPREAHLPLRRPRLPPDRRRRQRRPRPSGVSRTPTARARRAAFHCPYSPTRRALTSEGYLAVWHDGDQGHDVPDGDGKANSCLQATESESLCRAVPKPQACGGDHPELRDRRSR